MQLKVGTLIKRGNSPVPHTNMYTKKATEGNMLLAGEGNEELTGVWS